MKIIELTDKKLWNQFVAGHSSPASFLQSWEWGEFQKTQGQKILRLGIYHSSAAGKIGGSPIAIASLIKRYLPLPSMCYYYLPRGPVIRRDNFGSQQIIIKELLEKIASNYNKIIFLRIAPNWAKTANKTHWEDLKFKEPKILVKQKEPELTLLASLDKTDEELFEQMHHKTRYNIKLAKRKGVEFRFYKEQKDLDIFLQLLKSTANREKIKIYKKDYYTILLLATRLITDYQADLVKDNLRSVLGFTSWHGKTLACGLWLGFGDTLTYLHGGSSREERQVMAPYLLHWEMIKWARDQGFKYYDWWGIKPAATINILQLTINKKGERPKAKGQLSSLAGVTRFKKGFNGEEHMFAGTYDYIYNQKTFKYLNILKKLKEIF